MGLADDEPVLVPKRVQVVRAPRTRKVVRAGWDYVSLQMPCVEEVSRATTILEQEGTPKVVRDISLEAPDSWQGMSGGGVWWMTVDGTVRPEFGVTGLIFYQYFTAGGGRRMYAHAKDSLERLVNEVKAREGGLDYSSEIIRCYPVIRHR